MKNKSIHHSIFSIILPIGLILLIFSQWQTNTEDMDNEWNSIENGEKQKGVHFFGLIDSTNLQHLNQNNIEWLTLVSWGFQDDYDSPVLRHHDGDSLNIIKRDSAWLNRIKMAKAAGFKIFLKPHLWISKPSNGTWRSDIFPTNDKNWELWKNSYRDFIIRYAKIAEQAKVEMFCIGTEFSRLTIEKPLFWKNLIQEVRNIYSGKITYAANWYDEYEKITFWKDLDFIGIQAYFPLVSNNYPTLQQISKGWNKYLPSIKAIHKKYNRKVIFTEMGYKSTADSAIEPWIWMEKTERGETLISMETQSNCYEAFFNTVWEKGWFAGVHIWQMKDYDNSGGLDCLNFTPQNKPAEAIITKAFE